MNKFLLLSFGFVGPTPDIMAAWGKWFESIADKIVDQGGLWGGGPEISDAGTKDLPMGMDSITGHIIINADSLDAAERRNAYWAGPPD